MAVVTRSLVMSSLIEQETEALRDILAVGGELALDRAASLALLNTAAIIGHVRGYDRLAEILVLAHIANAA